MEAELERERERESMCVCVCVADAQCAEREDNGLTQVCFFLPSVMWGIAALPIWLLWK